MTTAALSGVTHFVCYHPRQLQSKSLLGVLCLVNFQYFIRALFTQVVCDASPGIYVDVCRR
jgi:hypothetical protein